MTLKPIASVLLILLFSPSLFSEDLQYTIKGQGGDTAELETYSPPPDIPTADSILFSLDGGQSAREDEVVPLSPYDAAILADSSHIPPPVLPLIPEAPFIIHSLPLGDKYDLKYNRDVFDKGREEAFSHYNWEFNVTDDNNDLLYQKTGKGKPSEPLTWDGFSDEKFVLNPNRTINSFFVLKSSDTVINSWPGEGVRFLCSGYWKEKNFVVQFSKRLYEKSSHIFSRSGHIFLSDLSRRLYYHTRQPRKPEAPATGWHLTLYEPRVGGESGLEEARKAMWQSYLEDVLDEEIDPEKISVEMIAEDEPWAEMTLVNHQPLELPNMWGKPAPPRPHFEEKAKWVNVKDVKNDLVIELRHDRLFLPGSAYLRDEALPDLAVALDRVKEEAHMAAELRKAEKTKKKKKKKRKKRNEEKTIILRSFTEKVHDKSRNKREEDPKLAALRSKVLFMLFSKERLVP